jgi:hypothetical protein
MVSSGASRSQFERNNHIFKKTIAKMMKHLIFLGILLTIVGFASSIEHVDPTKGSQAILFYDNLEEPIRFAAEDLKSILLVKGINVALKPLTDLPTNPRGIRIVIAKNDPKVIAALKAAGGEDVFPLGEQAYALRVTGKGENRGYWAIGGGRVGAMYGGIHIGEIVKAFGLEALKNENQTPYIAKRGIKFNIPLDERQPSHDDRGTAAQTNIAHMWDYEFWKEYLDVLARQRYNVLSLWNKHPFPSMVKLPDYPDVALNDVFNAGGKVKDITIEEKIDLWKKIMDYAYNRGIEVYMITWNIHMNGAGGKYGISENYESETTKDYLRKSVKELFLTYPRLAGIGVTAGENMPDMSDDEKEAWMWETYGKGIQDVQMDQPDRHIRFIHRYWWTSFDKIESRFGQLKDGFDMSFKYARARTYSSYAPKFAEEELLPNLPEGMATWWNIRNDDIYNLRWGDPDYVRQFILNFPEGDLTAGYYMGSDRYAWGRESISKNPTTPRMIENNKHWYSFLLWGRLGYDPETPNSFFKGLIQNRFPIAPGEKLFTAWQAASEIIPLVNKFHWFSWDYLWWPEAGISTGHGVAIAGYHDINDFINAPVLEGSNLLSIIDYSEAIVQGQKKEGITPIEVGDMLEAFAKKALKETEGLKGEDNNELSETLGDIRATAHLGNYYGKKIKGAAFLKLYMDSKKEEYKTSAIANLEEALSSWQQYAKILDEQYIKMNISMHGIFDWNKIELEVKEDVDIARNAE